MCRAARFPAKTFQPYQTKAEDLENEFVSPQLAHRADRTATRSECPRWSSGQESSPPTLFRPQRPRHCSREKLDPLAPGFGLDSQSSSEVTVALMTLDTALIAASMQRMPTPKTTEGALPSAAIAAVGVMRTAGTAAPAISSGVPRSCSGAVPRKAMLRRARHANSATHPVISLDERAMASRLRDPLRSLREAAE